MNWDKTYKWLTYALGLFPLMKLNHFSMLMIVWGLVSVIVMVRNRNHSQIKNYLKLISVMIFPFVMSLLVTPFLDNPLKGADLSVQLLPFLIFSFFFVVNKNSFSTQDLIKTVKTFMLSTVLIIVLSWINIFKQGFMQMWEENSFYHPVFRNVFHDTTNIHLPYLGILCCLASLALLYQIIKTKKHWLVSMLVIVFLQGSAYLFSARMALLCFVVAACFVLFKELKSNVLKIGVIAGIVALTVGIVVFSPIKERYQNIVEFKTELPNKDMQPHEVNYRYAIYHCTRQVLEKNWLFGVGVDKVQESLNVCYATFDYRGYDDFTKNAYNTHNQYADMCLKYGVFGLLGFVLFLIYFLIKGSFLHKIFILIFALALLTENMLNRQIGIVTFTFFNAIFVALNYPNFEKSISRRLVR